MPRTRRSLAHEDVTDSSIDASDRAGASTRPRAVNRALRRLLIDANPALKGEQTQKQKDSTDERNVYHWRGAVYAVDENTPQEWLDAQPTRYLKRKREVDDEEKQEEAEEESEQEVVQPVKRKRGRPRKHPLPEDQETKTVLGKRKRPSPANEQASTPRKRGRPPGRASRARYEESDNSEEEDEAETPPASRYTRSRGATQPTRRQSTPITNNKRRRVSPTTAARNEAKQKGFNVQPIPWADMMTGQIAISMTKFCALQSQLRKVKEEYKRASDLYDRIQERDKALEEQLNGENDDAREDSALDTTPEKNMPLTPDHSDSMQDAGVFHDDELDDIKQSTSQIDAQTQLSVKPLNRLALFSHQRVNFGPWDPLPRQDEQGNTLQWSLRSAKDMEGRAEYHIYTGKLHDREKHAQQVERIRRELAIIQQWEVVDGGQAFVHDEGRAKVPRRPSYGDIADAADRSPRRLPIDRSGSPASP